MSDDPLQRVTTNALSLLDILRRTKNNISTLFFGNVSSLSLEEIRHIVAFFAIHITTDKYESKVRVAWLCLQCHR